LKKELSEEEKKNFNIIKQPKRALSQISLQKTLSNASIDSKIKK
jgi:hypothetical protein